MKINSNSFSSLKVLSWIFFQKREKKLFCWVKLFSTWSWGVSIRLLTQPLGRCFPTKNVVWNGWECFHKKHFHLSLLRWMINKKIYLDLRNVSNFCLFTPPTNRKNYQFRQKFEHRRSRYFDASANPPPPWVDNEWVNSGVFSSPPRNLEGRSFHHQIWSLGVHPHLHFWGENLSIDIPNSDPVCPYLGWFFVWVSLFRAEIPRHQTG